MDMRTNFKFSIDGQESSYHLDGWQDAIEKFLLDLRENGFEIPERKVKQMVEFARFNRLTVRDD